MDKEEARFILQSFRPDGADTHDAAFTEALQLAMENRELGEWLAHERAFDAAFAEALGSIELPENLREDILACLAVERGDFPQAEDAADAEWIGMLATVKPPPELRGKILAAMDRTVAEKQVTRLPGNVSPFRRFAMPIAIAAAVALGFFVTVPPVMKRLADADKVSIQQVRDEVVHTLETHGSVPESPAPGGVALAKYLADRNLPAMSEMPRGLRDKPGFGCRELVIDGKRGALLCFHIGGKNGPVHLVIFRRGDIKGDFPADGHPALAQNGDWASARWADGDNVVMMVSNTNTEKLSAVF